MSEFLLISFFHCPPNFPLFKQECLYVPIPVLCQVFVEDIEAVAYLFTYIDPYVWKSCTWSAILKELHWGCFTHTWKRFRWWDYGMWTDVRMVVDFWDNIEQIEYIFNGRKTGLLRNQGWDNGRQTLGCSDEISFNWMEYVFFFFCLLQWTKYGSSD